jgi:hypothetical protein
MTAPLLELFCPDRILRDQPAVMEKELPAVTNGSVA